MSDSLSPNNELPIGSPTQAVVTDVVAGSGQVIHLRERSSDDWRRHHQGEHALASAGVW